MVVALKSIAQNLTHGLGEAPKPTDGFSTLVTSWLVPRARSGAHGLVCAGPRQTPARLYSLTSLSQGFLV